MGSFLVLVGFPGVTLSGEYSFEGEIDWDNLKAIVNEMNGVALTG
jgi:hypothetical protein